MLGETIADRYEIIRQLGQGGMGAVFHARHTGSGRRVALKVILKGKEDAKLRARFLREAQAAGQIESRHVAHVLDVGVDAERDLPFIAIEYLEGEDLGALLERAPQLPSRVVLKIAAQVAAGLVAAHAQGVVHRDIKPANIFLAHQDGEIVVKLLDFGIAKLVDTELDREAARLTATGALLGSPLYMSPEQALGSKAIDERTDVWSLGVVMYEALCGETPFGHCGAMGELLVEICVSSPPPPISVAPWVDPEASRVVEQALQLDAAARHPSASAMLAALRALLPGGTGLTASDLVRDPAATAVTPRERRGALARSPVSRAGATTAAVASDMSPPGKRSRATLAVAGAAIVAAAVGGVALTSARQDSPVSGRDPGAGALPSAVADAPTASAASAASAPGAASAPRAESTALDLEALPANQPVVTPGGGSKPRIDATASTPSARPAAAPAPSGSAPRKNYGF